MFTSKGEFILTVIVIYIWEWDRNDIFRNFFMSQTQDTWHLKFKCHELIALRMV